MLFFLPALVACSFDLTLPPEEAAPEGEPTVGRVKMRERRNILPGNISGPPPPEPGITRDECDAIQDGGPMKGDDCVTDVIRCGDTVVGHTIGGVNRYNTRFYEKNFCTPSTTNHNGGDERVYRLDVPDGDHTALVTMDSPCADLDLAALKARPGACPREGHSLPQCEMNPKDGTQRETVRLVTQNASTWYIVVEGKDEHEGAFALHVQCWNALY